uniref:Uncharacterized protein n=1 Tax=Cannabis sativa TaxID=3483 RepID=A0A803PHV7_CANSA
MGSKRTRAGTSGASSSNPQTPTSRTNFKRDIFVNQKAQERYFELQKKAFIVDQGIEYEENPIPNQPLFESIRQQIQNRKWEKLVDVQERVNQTLALEFLANWPEQRNGKVKVHKTYKVYDYVDMAETVGFLGMRFHEYPYDNQVQPKRKIYWVLLRNLKPPHLYGQLPSLPHRNQQPEAPIPEEENQNEEMPQEVPSPLEAGMQHIHA